MKFYKSLFPSTLNKFPWQKTVLTLLWMLVFLCSVCFLLSALSRSMKCNCSWQKNYEEKKQKFSTLFSHNKYYKCENFFQMKIVIKINSSLILRWDGDVIVVDGFAMGTFNGVISWNNQFSVWEICFYRWKIPQM